MKAGKKGQAHFGNIFLFMIVGFALVVCSIIFVFIGNVTYTNIMAQNETLQANFPGVNVTDVINDTIGKLPTAYSSLRWITVMLIIGMAIAILVASFLVQERPVIFVLYLIVLIVAIVVSVPLSNAFETVYNTPFLASSFEGFWGATFIFLNLPYWVTAIGFLSAILMFVSMARASGRGIA